MSILSSLGKTYKVGEGFVVPSLKNSVLSNKISVPSKEENIKKILYGNSGIAGGITIPSTPTMDKKYITGEAGKKIKPWMYAIPVIVVVGVVLVIKKKKQ